MEKKNCAIQQPCYECSLFITSDLQYLWNTPDLTPGTPVLWTISGLWTIFPFSDYNSITFLVLLFHISVLLYPPFDNSDIPIIVPHSCLIVPSCIWTYCPYSSGLIVHTLPDLLSVLFWTYCPYSSGLIVRSNFPFSIVFTPTL